MTDKDKERIIKAYNKWSLRYAKSNKLLVSEVGNTIRKYENREHRYVMKITKDALKKWFKKTEEK